MTDDIDRKIKRDFFNSLSNKDIPNPKNLVLFSGVPGSGKTTLAKAIENDLHSVRLSNDELRDLILSYDTNIELVEREKIKSEVRETALDKLPSIANGLIVLDGSCDREDGYYYSWARKNAYRVILLRLEVDRKEIERRIESRGDEGYKKVSRLNEMLDRWWADWEAFGKTYKPDIKITPDTSKSEILMTLRKIISNGDYAVK